ncbi:MAG: hypothetical protein ACRBCS_16090 [Cellvibrionaceae bacterium]
MCEIVSGVFDAKALHEEVEAVSMKLLGCTPIMGGIGNDEFLDRFYDPERGVYEAVLSWAERYEMVVID